MIVRDLEIEPVKLIEFKIHGDERGWFSETYREQDWEKILGKNRFIQDNQSFSAAPFTLRGIHFQKPPYAQAKLIQVLMGEVFDVAIDLRKDSPSFGKWVSTTLRAGDGRQFFIPIGFGHAFMTLVPNTMVQYKVTAPYHPEAEGGLPWNDPTLAIEWPKIPAPPILSDRDRKWSPFSRSLDSFPAM